MWDAKRGVIAAMAVAMCSHGCTVLLPTTATIMAANNSDVEVDEHGCQHLPGRDAGPVCLHPGPVEYGRTVGENLLAGLVIDVLILAAAASGYHDN